MAWGTKKFTKNLIRPNASSNNNALVSFMSRVPDNEELVSIFLMFQRLTIKVLKLKKNIYLFQKNFEELHYPNPQETIQTVPSRRVTRRELNNDQRDVFSMFGCEL